MKIKDSLLPIKRNYLLSDILIGIVFTLFLISVGVLTSVYFRPLYYMNIGLSNIEEASGLSSQEIKENYNALIDYCSPFYNEELKFPSLPASESGLSHFAEVKVIFNIFHITALISFVICCIVFTLKKYYDYYGHLLISSVTAILLPLIIGTACIINFNSAFNLMHKIIFRNDDWLFDPEKDPIIMLLPERYFMHCAMLIILIVLTGSFISLMFYLYFKKKHKTDSLMPMKKNYFY